MSRQRVLFSIGQETPSFPEGAPDRANYFTDNGHLRACARYAAEWKKLFECEGCGPDTPEFFDCPQCGDW